jgi:ABC-type Fe3+/spermidine/putrescine transport system ATPase subunit
VFDNVAFGLRIRKTPKDEIESRVEEMLSLVNLPNYGQRSIAALSGGEKQRVALARALVNRPAILLLDEPLGALDLQLRRKMQFEIKEIHRKVGTTFIYVTHDQEEALSMSDRIAVMKKGQVEQVGEPQTIYDRPESRFVARFLGSSNLLEGEITERATDQNEVQVAVDGFDPIRTTTRNGAQPGDRVGLVIRPEKIQVLHDVARAQGIPAMVEETLYLGALIQYKVRVGEHHALFAVQHATAQKAPIKPGQNVRIRWAPEDLVLVEK